MIGSIVSAMALRSDEECVALINSFDGDVNELSRMGETLLIAAVYNGRVATIAALARKGADPHLTSDYGITPLCHAAAQNNDSVATLLTTFPFINVSEAEPCGSSRTPLHWAAFCGRVRNVELLLQHGADCRARDRTGATPEDLAMKAKRRVQPIVGALRLAVSDGLAVPPRFRIPVRNTTPVPNATAVGCLCRRSQVRASWLSKRW
jgi:hypothetical protein